MFDHVAWDLLLELVHEERTLRSRSHQGHVSFQNIEKLWKFIDIGLSHEAADRGDTGVIGRGPFLLFFGRILNAHGTEFVHLKLTVVQADTGLAKDQRAFVGELDDDGNQNHRNGGDHQRDQSQYNVHRPLDHLIERGTQRHVAHMDDREAIEILSVWLGRYDVVVVRDELGVHTGFLTDSHDLFKFGKLIDAQSDRNLIVFVGLKKIAQTVGLADDRDLFELEAQWLFVIQDTVYFVAPFRMDSQTADVALRGTAVAHQQNMLQILAGAAHLTQDATDGQTESIVNHQIHAAEDYQKQTRIVGLVQKVKDCCAVDDAKEIGFDQTEQLGSAPCGTLGIVQVAQIVHDQVGRDQKNQHIDVLADRKNVSDRRCDDVVRDQRTPGVICTQIIGEDKGGSDNGRVDQYLYQIQ